MKRLVSERRYHHAMAFEVVKEWEDVFCKKLNTGIICLHMNFFIKAWNRLILYYIPFTASKRRWRIGFVWSAGSDRMFRMRNVIPIYIDFHPRIMDKLAHDTRKLPCYFVPSMEFAGMLNEKSGKNNCFFLPQSVPDKYIPKVNVEKTIDVIQIGRKNKVLHEYMLRYCEKNPGVNYVYMSDVEKFQYISTTNGRMGSIDTREEFIDTLRRARISLVSSPGRDNSSRRYDESVDFFTARFYESVAARCFLVGRYTENRECEYLGIKDVCYNANSYEEFEKAIAEYLVKDIGDVEETYMQFLNNNSTSKQFERVMQVMREKGFEVERC